MTGKFDVVLGTEVTASDFGYRLQPATEGLAFEELDEPITGRAIIRLKYRSAVEGQQTMNGALVLADRPTNADSFKVGTAIGMSRHVAFAGGWNNVGSGAAKRVELKPTDTFALELHLDVAKRTATAVINGTTLNVKLPDQIEAIRHIGLYNKATATEFTLPVMERSRP